jgi:hypothetical protein
MVKWLGEANIALPAGATTAITGLLVHTQAGVTSGTFDTTSNIQEDKANGICLDCSGELRGRPGMWGPGWLNRGLQLLCCSPTLLQQLAADASCLWLSATATKHTACLQDYTA